MEARMKEWIVAYLKHKDVIRKSITSIEEKDDHVLVTYKDGKELALVVSHLDDAPAVLKRLGKHTERAVLLVTLNTKKNLSALIAHWKQFAALKTLKVFFINPDTQGEQKWIIAPYVHNSIADSASLRSGLASLAEQVPFAD